MPRFQGLAKFHLHAVASDTPVAGKAKFQVRGEPGGIKAESKPSQILEDVVEVLGDEVREHEPVMKLRSPADQRAAIGRFPEPCHQRPEQEMLRQAHASVRRHLERPQFQQPQASGAGVGREKLIDAELGPMSIAGDVDQEVAEQTVHEPRRHLGRGRLRPGSRHWRQAGIQLPKSHLQLVERIVPGFIQARVAGWWAR